MALSLKSPVGVPLYWESRANPPQEWPSWLSTFKLAVLAKENLHVDQLSRLKPTAADLFYPTVPSYEDVIEGTNKEETRKRQIRNERRRVDWENECRAIRNRGPMLDRYTWDDADIKVKSLVYLSLRTEAGRIYHQRNPHTLIDRCSTNELIYELGKTFTRPRNIKFDRFQLITVQQISNENLETFFSRLHELVSKAALGNVEEHLIKDFFIAKMNNSAIQMELLSEVRTPAQVLNFALSRERGQENQKEILRANPANWNQVNATSQQTNRTQTRPQTSTQRQHQTQDLQPCWRCGAPFSQGHNINCPAKGAQFNICKKMGHFAKTMSIKDDRTSQTETTSTNTTTIIQSIPREQPNKTCSTCDGTKSRRNSSNDRGREWIKRPRSNTLSKRTHWRLGKHQPGKTKIIPTSTKYHRKQNTKRWNMDPNNMQQLRKNRVARRYWIAPKLY